MSELPFIFFTIQDSYYEKPETTKKLPFQSFPCIHLSPADEVLMIDYRKAYLEGVRQQSIRGQTTKDNPATLLSNSCISGSGVGKPSFPPQQPSLALS